MAINRPLSIGWRREVHGNPAVAANPMHLPVAELHPCSEGQGLFSVAVVGLSAKNCELSFAQ